MKKWLSVFFILILCCCSVVYADSNATTAIAAMPFKTNADFSIIKLMESYAYVVGLLIVAVIILIILRRKIGKFSRVVGSNSRIKILQRQRLSQKSEIIIIEIDKQQVILVENGNSTVPLTLNSDSSIRSEVHDDEK